MPQSRIAARGGQVTGGGEQGVHWTARRRVIVHCRTKAGMVSWVACANPCNLICRRDCLGSWDEDVGARGFVNENTPHAIAVDARGRRTEPLLCVQNGWLFVLPHQSRAVLTFEGKSSVSATEHDVWEAWAWNCRGGSSRAAGHGDCSAPRDESSSPTEMTRSSRYLEML